MDNLTAQRVPLFNPQTAPALGMFSGMHPTALTAGQFSLLQNVRIDDGTLTARQPTTDRSATGIPASAVPRGAWSGKLNGTETVVATWFDPAVSKIRIYESFDAVAFTEVTQTSGPFGDTRLSDPGIPLAFCRFNHPSDLRDYLLVQNGTDAPLVYSPISLNGSKLRKLNPLAAPLWASSTRPRPTVGATPTFSVSVTVTNTGSGHLTGTYVSFDHAAINLGVGTASGDSLTWTYPAMDLRAGRQLWIVCDNAAANVWNSFKVELVSGAVSAVVADPSGAIGGPFRVGFSDTTFGNTPATGGTNGQEIVAFDLGAIPPSVLQSVTAVRFTWVGATTTAAQTVNVQGVCLSGNYPAFGPSFWASYTGAGGLVESAGVAFAPVQGSCAVNGNSFGAAFSAAIPYAAGLYYDFIVYGQECAPADLANGVDSLLLYRQDAGSNLAFYEQTKGFATYTAGAWKYTASGSTSTQTPNAIVAPIDGSVLALDPTRVAPDAYCVTVPKATAMAAANQRVFVGGQGGYWVSEFGQPTRFRQQLAVSGGFPVERSASHVTLAGERVQAFALIAGTGLGVSTVFILTDQQAYVVAGFDGFSLSRPTRVASVGCGSAKSVATYKDRLYFLDTEGQVRRNFQTISKRIVDDRTRGIPAARQEWAQGVASQDRYYLAYSTGSSNTQILVFDETVGAWVEDTLATGAEGLLASALSPRSLIVFGADSHVYVHENPLATGTVAVRIGTREVHSDLWASQFYGRVGVVADVQAGQTAALVKTLRPNASDVSAIDLSAGAVNQVWRWDNRSGSQPGQRGVTCQISFQAAMTSGTKLYSMVLEVRPTGEGADQ